MPRSPTKSLPALTRPGLVTYAFSPSHHIVTITIPPHSPWSSGLHWHAQHTEYLEVERGAARLTLDGATRTLRAGDGAVRIGVGVRHEWRRAGAGGGSRVGGRNGGESRVEGGNEGGGRSRVEEGNGNEGGSKASDNLLQGEDDEELVVKEWTTPMDGQKEIFFRNLSSVLGEDVEGEHRNKPAGYVGALWLLLQLGVIFWAGDNWPVVVSLGGTGGGGRGDWREWFGAWVEWIVTMVVLVLARVVGGLGWGMRGWYEEYTPDELVRGRERKDR